MKKDQKNWKLRRFNLAYDLMEGFESVFKNDSRHKHSNSADIFSGMEELEKDIGMKTVYKNEEESS